MVSRRSILLSVAVLAAVIVIGWTWNRARIDSSRERVNPAENFTSVRASERGVWTQLRRERKEEEDQEFVRPSPKAAARCAEAKSRTRHSLANARLYLAGWKGDESDDNAANRGIGCFYKSGRRIDFGFNDVVEGDSFGFAKSAGDFVAFTTNIWTAGDDSYDGMWVWNMRTGIRAFGDKGCGGSQSDCWIADFELLEDGSLAYSQSFDTHSQVVIKRPGKKRRIVGRSRDGTVVLVSKHGRLYWLAERDQLKSVQFK